MHALVRRPILALGGLLLGYGLAAAGARGRDATRPAAPATPPVSPRLAIPCVDLASASPACPALDAPIAACTSRLAAATASRPTTRRPFPEDVPEAETPGPWTDALAEDLDACHIPATLEVADCAEYPCAAALRPDHADDAAVTAAWNACPALAERQLSVTKAEVHCPDGSTERSLVAWSDDDAVVARMKANGVDGNDGVAVALGRRVESTLQLWDCNVAGD